MSDLTQHHIPQADPAIRRDPAPSDIAPAHTVQKETHPADEGQTGKLRAVQDAVQDKAGAARDTLRAHGANISEATRETARAGADQVAVAQDGAARAVRENPMMALGAAVGVGILLGLAMRGRY